MYSELEPVQTHEGEERIFGRRPFGGFGGFGRPGGFGGFGRPGGFGGFGRPFGFGGFGRPFGFGGFGRPFGFGGFGRPLALEDHLDLEALEALVLVLHF